MSDKNRPDNMDELKNASVLDGVPATHMQSIPQRAAQDHAKKLTAGGSGNSGKNGGDGDYSLNDDRRVKVLSPGALVAKRFFRNRIAMVGLIVLAAMFAFSFIGGIVTPYGEEQFYRTDYLMKEYASAKEVTEYLYSAAPGENFGGVIQAQALIAFRGHKTEFDWKGVTYTVDELGEDFFAVSIKDGNEIGIAFKGVISGMTADDTFSYEFKRAAFEAYTNDGESFTAEGVDYTIDEDAVISDADGREIGYVSGYIVNAWYPDVFLDREFKERLSSEIAEGAETFKYTDEEGVEHECTVTYDPANLSWIIKQATPSRVLDTYSDPFTKEHWLGTDGNGMDMITRLMYGGRVSLIIGFIVEFIATLLGVIMGGISGYFGGWVDNLIMRIVDVFYCIPSTPILIILGAAMDAMSVNPKIRMVYLMLILGFLGWPGMARLVRGQILSLREQEFMTATEATGLTVRRRIFKHLVPNVIPQLIVSCTMGLGSTIITEATLSFLGLGVKYPFASWGNIISDVTTTHVLTNYWFVWIPAGVLLLLTVLAFNLVGDGLRDAFDPKMKR